MSLVEQAGSELGLADPAPLAELPAEQLSWLCEAVRHAREREHAALQAAVDRALEQIPWVLRGAVRKVLFP